VGFSPPNTLGAASPTIHFDLFIIPQFCRFFLALADRSTQNQLQRLSVDKVVAEKMFESLTVDIDFGVLSRKPHNNLLGL